MLSYKRVGKFENNSIVPSCSWLEHLLHEVAATEAADVKWSLWEVDVVLGQSWHKKQKERQTGGGKCGAVDATVFGAVCWLGILLLAVESRDIFGAVAGVHFRDNHKKCIYHFVMKSWWTLFCCFFFFFFHFLYVLLFYWTALSS